MNRRIYMKGKLVRDRDIEGFDYRIRKGVSHTAAEWREELRQLVSHGGFRRVDHGETFGHDKRGLIEFEIYGNVAV